jgi:hypothetical protein
MSVRSTSFATLALLLLAQGCADNKLASSPSADAIVASVTPGYAWRFKGLFVSDLGVKYGQGGVLQLGGPKYAQTGKLQDGMYLPDGNWFDSARNFYVANVDGRNVTEYAPGSRRPTCTYTGASDPTNVKTDKNGNVYVVDWNDGSSGAIDVYAQCKNAMIRRYTFGTATPSDLAFDASGNLFVLYLANGAGALEEFKAGSTTPTPLGATLKFPGGLAIDKRDNLIAADQGVNGKTNGAIDVIAPPYATAKPLVRNLAQPVFLSLNAREDTLYADSFYFAQPTVWVFDYPSGKLAVTLGAANGLSYPLGVAAAPEDTR